MFLFQLSGSGAMGAPGRIRPFIYWMVAGLILSTLLTALDLLLFRRGVRLSVRLSITVFTAIAAAIGAVLILNLPPFRAITTLVFWFGFIGGLFLISYGIMGRIQPGPRCARCGYERGDPDSMPDQCPECGAVWSAAGGIVDERAVRTPSMIVGGVAVALVSVLFYFSASFGRNPFSTVLPTSVLLAQAASAQFLGDAEWQTLMARKPPAPDLAGAMLDYRTRSGHLPVAADTWLVSYITSPAATPALRERFYRESAAFRIELPPTVRPGQPITVTIDCRRTLFTPTMHVAGAVRSAEINGVPSLVGGPLWQLGSKNQQVELPPVAGPPGAVTVTLDLDLVVGPTPIRLNTDTRAADGTLIPPPGMHWQGTVRITGTTRLMP
jgi:hypothetical protein